MAVFYHISKDLRHNGVFTPRIPSNRYEGQDKEDDTTPRITVSTTIEGCLSAMPGGGLSLEETNIETRGYYLVFRIDTEKLGIPNSAIVSSDYLFKNELVPDADNTEEHWITVPFTVPKEDRFIIRLYNWSEDCVDVIPYKIYLLADKEYEGDYFQAFIDTYGFGPECMAVITQAFYVKENVEKGTVFELFYEWPEEKSLLVDIIEGEYAGYLKIIKEYNESLEIEVIKDCNLRKLFMEHYKLLRIYQ